MDLVSPDRSERDGRRPSEKSKRWRNGEEDLDYTPLEGAYPKHSLNHTLKLNLFRQTHKIYETS